jgi:uncharacterized protein
MPFIDALRGFALFGVFGANLMIFSGIYLMTDEQKAAVMTTVFDRVANVVQLFFVETKFIGLFSLLFGISFWLFLDRARSRTGSATHLFYRRIGWLFLFGALHGWLLWCYDILRFYALFAIFLPLFVRMPLRKLLAVALSMSILVPAVMVGVFALFAEPGSPRPAPDYEALLLVAASTGEYSEVLSANWNYDWYLILDIDQAYLLAVFGRLLLGLYAVRALNLANLDGHRAAFKTLLLAGAIVGAAGNVVFTSHFLADAEGFVLPFLRKLVVESGYLGLTLAYAAGLALLFMNPRCKRAVLLLAPIGQMALTWFLLQTMFGIWLFYGFVPGGPHLMGKVGPAWLTLIWVVGFAVQIGFAHAWMRRFRFGPAEWLWRTLTYWQVQPFKVDAHTAG